MQQGAEEGERRVDAGGGQGRGQVQHGKKRKDKNSKDYAFRHQFNEKPSIIPGCPGSSKVTKANETVMQTKDGCKGGRVWDGHCEQGGGWTLGGGGDRNLDMKD